MSIPSFLRKLLAPQIKEAAESDESLNSRGEIGGFLAICAIMKNEGVGILEWIAYHHALGVEKFFLYDNGSEDDTLAKVAPLRQAGLVEVVTWPLRPGQIQAYDDFAARHGARWTWCAFIDLDEFVVPFACESIPEWLARFEGRSGVALQWVNFGPNGHDEPPAGLAIEGYRTRFPDGYAVHGHVKTVVRMNRYAHALNPHAFAVTEGEIVDENDRPVVRNGQDYAIQAPMGHDAACLNHYYTRSRREWRIKLERGRTDAPDKPENLRDPTWLDIYEREAIIPDDRIQKFAARTAAMLARLTSIGTGQQA
jgi:hypothetical protein